ncbi:hypothetical protein NGH74_13885 [Staphylococcus pseudoxylosus]|uniref:hypothetical protein n=1 Tax=Staphylococcus pseudoxylosus TaxID=2282419 RepID=UPI002DB7C238|nr:hypothetical protein [Staphylococcus pseudoxylosus]MEB8088251.1 hypothetical protein [Staphylococcus pseudoxylosus]
MNTINTLKLIGAAIINNLIPLLFLIGLILVNTAIYVQWGLVTGFIVTGITLILIALILVGEKNQQPPQ